MTSDFDPQALTVSDLMTSAPATVDEGLSVADAQERMFHNKIRHLIVTRGNTAVVGVVSQRDLSLAASLNAEATVANAMSGEPFTCEADVSLSDVVTKMEAERYGCAIVMEASKPIGMFTTTDALRAVRSLLAGKVEAPLKSPTHRVDQGGERSRVEHLTRVGDSVGKAHAKPSPNQGTIR